MYHLYGNQKLLSSFPHWIREKMRVLYHLCYHVIISLCFPDSWLCLFNELATRWSERSVPVSFIQITFMMNTPHPVTSHKASTLHSMQHNTEKYVAANSSDPPCWGSAVPSDLIRHNSLLLWGTFPPLNVCDSCLRGEQNTPVYSGDTPSF